MNKIQADFFEALKTMDFNECERLVAGADLNAKDENDLLPMDWAINDPSGVLVKLLINHGDSVNPPGFLESGPLHGAAWKEHIHVCRVLLDAGADIKAQDHEGWTPLHIAAYTGSVGLCDLLISRGAPLEARENTSSTPLHVAAARQKDALGACNALINAGALLSARDGDDMTPLHVAARELFLVDNNIILCYH